MVMPRSVDSDDSSSSDDSDGGLILSSSQRNKLVAFLNRPRAVILGAVLSAILQVLYDIWSELLDAVMWLFEGSEPGYDQGEQLGLADLPRYVLDLFRREPFSALAQEIAAINDVIVGAISGVEAALPPVLDPIVVPALILLVLSALWIIGKYGAKTVVGLVSPF